MSASHNDSIKKTLIVTVLLCLVCSVVVSAAAVFLKPVQERNKQADMQRNVLAIAGVLNDRQPLAEQFAQFDVKLVDLRSGRFTDELDVERFEQRSAAKDPALSSLIPANQDQAGLKRRSNFTKVFLLKDQGELKTIVLPVHGKGLWSTMYGFLALSGDLNTVVGFGFYEQGETPGLGGEVDNPKWKAKWPGKQLFDAEGNAEIELVKGAADPSGARFAHQVDGLAGATLTTNGVQNLLDFWMGEQGYRTFLSNLKAGEA